MKTAINRPDSEVACAAERRAPHGQGEDVGVILNRTGRDRVLIEHLQDVDEHRDEDDGENRRRTHRHTPEHLPLPLAPSSAPPRGRPEGQPKAYRDHDHGEPGPDQR